MSRPTVVIFEPYITGHRREYLNHLLEYLIKNETSHQIVFVVNPEFSEPCFQSSDPSFRRDKVFRAQFSKNCREQPSIHRLSQNEFESLFHKNIVKRSFRYFRLAKKYALENSADHFLFLSLNDVQLALGLLKFPCSVSGILFKPFYRMNSGAIKNRLIRMRKFAQTWLFARKEMINPVYILNDQKAVNYLNQNFKTRKFEMLPDPLPLWVADPVFIVREHYGIKAGRKILLHAGTLSNRKGTIEILESLQFLTKEEQRQFALIIIGRPENGMEGLIKTKIEKARIENPNIQIIDRLEHVPNQVFQAYLEQCDAVLMPYSSEESSSGVAGHAIAKGKRLIGVNRGLLGEMIHSYGNGVLMENNSPRNIAVAIQDSMSSGNEATGSIDFINSHQSENFAKHIFTDLLAR